MTKGDTVPICTSFHPGKGTEKKTLQTPSSAMLVKDAHEEIVLDRTPSPYDEEKSSRSSSSWVSLEEKLQRSCAEDLHARESALRLSL